MPQAIIKKSSDEKRALRRRHTTALEWLDTETDPVIQPPTILQGPIRAWKPTRDLAKTKAETRTTANQIITTSAIEGGHDHYARPGDEPELRLGRKHFGARISYPDEPQSSGASPDAGTELLHMDIILKTILLLTYAICGIGVVAWKAAKRVIKGVCEAGKRKPESLGPGGPRGNLY